MAQVHEGLTFVLPVTEHQGILAKTLDAWLSTLANLNHPYELLIVNDASTDDSPAIAEKYAAKHPTIRILTHTERGGFGACLKTAYEHSAQPLFFYTSCEPGWNPADLGRMLKSIAIKDEYTGKYVEVVNGHRRGSPLPPQKLRWNKLRRLLTRIIFGYWPEPPKGWLSKAEDSFWWRCRIEFGLRVGDINSKFKLFRRSVLDRIVIQSQGEFVHAELLAKANFLGCMMDEIVLADKQAIPPLPDTKADRRRVFNDPQFRAPIPAPTS
jgi:glycosyltransferase involved in cell wall biosynthesis